MFSLKQQLVAEKQTVLGINCTLPVGSFNEDSFAKLSNVQSEEPAGLGSYFLDPKSYDYKYKEGRVYVPDRLPKPPLEKNESEKVREERYLDKLKVLALKRQ